MKNDSVLLADYLLSRAELQVLIREEMQGAIVEYEKVRAQSDKFSHLPKYLSKKETAELFNVSVGTISNWAKWGWLEQVKMGRSCRFEKDAIVKLILNGGLTKYRGIK